MIRDSRDLKSCLENVENGISNVTTQLSSYRLLVESNKADFNRAISELENKIDNKFTAFDTLLNDHLKTKMTALEDKMTRRFGEMITTTQNKVGEFKRTVYNGIRTLEGKINQIQENDSNCDHTQKFKEIEKNLKDIDIPSLNSMSDAVVTTQGQVTELTKELGQSRKEIENFKKRGNATAPSGSNKRTNGQPPVTEQRSDNVDRSDEVVFFMDSNRKILDITRLWDSDKSRHVAAGSLQEIARSLDRYVMANTKCVVLHCGTNDLDRFEPTDVTNMICDVVDAIYRINSDTKIVISELLPIAKTRGYRRVCQDVNSTVSFHHMSIRIYSSYAMTNSGNTTIFICAMTGIWTMQLRHFSQQVYDLL